MSPERMSVAKISISNIDPNPFASRLSIPNLTELRLSLEKNGQLSPITVRPSSKEKGRYELVYGYRRLEAARSLKWTDILAEVMEVPDDKMILFALVENLDRDNYTDYEQGMLFRRLNEEFHQSITEIAASVGKSISYVSQHISMTRLFDSDGLSKREVSEVLSQLTERQARILARLKDPNERLQWARFCLSESLGTEEMDRLVGHPWPAERWNWRDECRKNKRVKDENEIRQIIEKTVEGLSKKDISPRRTYRIPKYFTLFDDFPPLGLLDYDSAAEQSYRVVRSMEKLNMSVEDLKIWTFGNFGYTTFFIAYKIIHSDKLYLAKSRVTFVFIKHKEKWYIAHEHWSPVQPEFASEISTWKDGINAKPVLTG